MRYLFTGILSLAFYYCSAQPSLDKMMLQLQGADYSAIRQAKSEIIAQDRAAVPRLIALLKDTSFVPLTNTFDLIYPGTKDFLGHGAIVRYDIDWIAVRAGWVLETLTFRNFGYRDTSITEERLMKLVIDNYQAYLKKGSYDVDFSSKLDRQQLIALRLRLADTAAGWWEKHKRNWSRYDALKEALASNDAQRQEAALDFLNDGSVNVEGLSLDKYESELKPLLEKIKASNNEGAERVVELLDDEKHEWYTKKQMKVVPKSYR
ncbi:hypothetical protein [Taibaiella koreensis]|uniref:hypothetical protein n=1 Tax=Taibaiella koreensis TaxID=1268548 RepID=UPI000E59D03D|nr:hypothetical protein [Taibaiella koreensis]